MHASLVSTNFARWGDALLTRDSSQVTDLYAENVTLLPTMAQQVIHDRKGVAEYFTFFLSLQPVVSIVEEYVAELSDESYVHCGVYRFSLTVEGQTQEVDARFTIITPHEFRWCKFRSLQGFDAMYERITLIRSAS